MVTSGTGKVSMLLLQFYFGELGRAEMGYHTGTAPPRIPAGSALVPLSFDVGHGNGHQVFSADVLYGSLPAACLLGRVGILPFDGLDVKLQ